MKYFNIFLFVASFCILAVLAPAHRTASNAVSDYSEGTSGLFIKERSVFTGMVYETPQGVAITTNRGTFLLKGADLQKLVGKNVLVTGVVRNGSIFAMKIDVKS